jgi:hypothetical protein
MSTAPIAAVCDDFAGATHWGSSLLETGGKRVEGYTFEADCADGF